MSHTPQTFPASILCFNIGDLPIALVRTDGHPLQLPNERYPQFLFSPKEFFPPETYPSHKPKGPIPRLRFTLHSQGLPEIPRGTFLFRGSTQWHLYKRNGAYLVEYLKPRKKIPHILCRFKKDFSEGDIYFDKDLKEGYLQPILQFLIANLLSRHQGIMVHASGIVTRKEGFVFVGPSGVGKTTLAHLFSGQKGVTVLNDERLIVRKIGKAFWLYGTPWNTVFGGCSSEKAPLKRIFFISHAKRNTLSKADGPQAFYAIFSQLFLQYWDREAIRYSMSLCEELLERIPSSFLGFVNNRSVLSFLKKHGI